MTPTDAMLIVVGDVLSQGFRADKVATSKAKIAAGTLVNRVSWEVAADRLLDDLKLDHVTACALRDELGDRMQGERFDGME